MHAQSHYHLGQFLIHRHLQHRPRRYRHAFLAGCLEPDRNPVTYLKGSIRCHWLRGHHWANSQRYMQRISRRLENRPKLNLLDFYTLGKLIHYTADAFTFAHNDFFTLGLSEHRHYERMLNTHFLDYLKQEPVMLPRLNIAVMEMIHAHHKEYSNLPGDIHRDCLYSVSVCCQILERLLLGPELSKRAKASTFP